jgi:hypothetical protein
MKVAGIAILLVVGAAAPLAAQQQTQPKTEMAIDLPEVVAEVKAAFERYEKRLSQMIPSSSMRLFAMTQEQSATDWQILNMATKKSWNSGRAIAGQALARSQRRS